MDYGKISTPTNNYYLKSHSLEGRIRYFKLHDHSIQKNPIGFAQVIDTGETSTTAFLTYIYVIDKVRRQGVASLLLDIVKKNYSRVTTQIATTEGRDLCLKNGFRWVKGLSRNQTDELIWQYNGKENVGSDKTENNNKENENGKEIKEREKETEKEESCSKVTITETQKEEEG